MSIKTFLCNRIQWANTKWVESIDGTTINLKSGFNLQKVTTSKATIQESLKTSDAGDLITQTMSVSASEPVSGAILLQNATFIISMSLSDGRQVIFGTLDKPVRLKTLVNDINNLKMTLIRLTNQFEY